MTKDIVFFGIVIWQAIALISRDSQIKEFEDKIQILQDQNLSQERDLTEMKLEKYSNPPKNPLQGN